MCHGNEGRGDGPAARPHARKAAPPQDLTQPKVQSRITDGEIFWKITTGFRYSGKKIMPAFGEDIHPESDRWSVVHFVRSLAQPNP